MIDLALYPSRMRPSTVERCQARGCRLAPSAHDDEAAVPVPRLAIAGTDLCTFHADKFPVVLKDLARLVPDLEHHLTRRTSTEAPGGGGKTSTVRDIATLWNPAIAHVRWELEDWTRFLVRTVMRERPLPDRDEAHAMLTELRVLEQHWRVLKDAMDAESIERLQLLAHHRVEIESRTLLTHGLKERGDVATNLAALALHHGHWLARYPTLGIALYQDATRHRNAALAALQARPIRRRGLRNQYCQEIVGETMDGPVTCLGQLVVVITDDDDPRPSSILCEENPAHQQMQRQDWLDLVVRETVHDG